MDKNLIKDKNKSTNYADKAEQIMDMNRSNTHNYTSIFMFILFIIGVTLIVVSWDIDEQIQTINCESRSLKTANKLALSIGIIFATSSLAFYSCSRVCGNTLIGFHYRIYIIMMFLLGILLIVLGSIIANESAKSQCANKGNPTIIWGLGTIIVVSCLLYFFKKGKF